MKKEKVITPSSEFISEKGLSIKKVSARFGIPYRTAQNWNAGVNKCPDYVLCMMKEILEKES